MNPVTNRFYRRLPRSVAVSYGWLEGCALPPILVDLTVFVKFGRVLGIALMGDALLLGHVVRVVGAGAVVDGVVIDGAVVPVIAGGGFIAQ